MLFFTCIKLVACVLVCACAIPHIKWIRLQTLTNRVRATLHTWNHKFYKLLYLRIFQFEKINIYIYIFWKQGLYVFRCAPTSMCHFFRPSVCPSVHPPCTISQEPVRHPIIIFGSFFSFIFLKFWFFGLLVGRMGVRLFRSHLRPQLEDLIYQNYYMWIL